MAKKPRPPKWDELNRIHAAGIINPGEWAVVRRNWEIMIIQNKRTGAVREIDMGGKLRPMTDCRQDMSESLARELMARRTGRC